MFSATVLLLFLPAVLCQTYLESLNSLLMSQAELNADGKFNYGIVLSFRDDNPEAIDAICGDEVTVNPLCFIMGWKQNASEVALPLIKWPCTVDPELGTTIYRVEPDVFIRERGTGASNGYNGIHQTTEDFHNFGQVNADDRFCLFMLDAGVSGEGLVDVEKPFIHWAVCNMQRTSAAELIQYTKVPATSVSTRTMVFVLLKQASGTADIEEITPTYLGDTCGSPGRCQFDIRTFMTDNALTVAFVMNAKAVPDVVGLDVFRELGFTIDCEGVYPTVIANTDIEDGSLPASFSWSCASVMSHFNNYMQK